MLDSEPSLAAGPGDLRARDASGASQSIRESLTTATLAILVCAATLLRLTGLESLIYWNDEVITRVRASGYTLPEAKRNLLRKHGSELSPAEIIAMQSPSRDLGSDLAAIWRTSMIEPHMPAYYSLVRIWQAAYSEASSARALSALFSALSLPAAFLLARALGASRKTAALALLFMCLSPYQLQFAREARAYSLLMLLSVTAAWLLYSSLGKASWIRALLLLCLSALGCLSHPLYLGIVAGQLAYATGAALSDSTKRKKTLFAACPILLGAIAAAPWLVTALGHDEFARHFTNEPRTISDLAAGWFALLPRFVSDVQDHSWFPDGLGWCVRCLALLSILASWGGAAFSPAGRYLLCCFVAPSLFLALCDLLAGGFRSAVARYIFACAAGTPMLLALALAGRFKAFEPIKAVLAALSISSALAFALAAPDHFHKEGVTTAELSEAAGIVSASPAPLIVWGISPMELYSLAPRLPKDAQVLPTFLRDSVPERREIRIPAERASRQPIFALLPSGRFERNRIFSELRLSEVKNIGPFRLFRAQSRSTERFD